MTLPLIDSWEIEPAEGKPYTVNAVCANPGCFNPAEHGHHLVRRSQIIGDVWWIRLPDGIVIGNVLGLCAPCHALVTGTGGKGGGHGAAIRWINDELWWCRVERSDEQLPFVIDYHAVAPCSSQTPHAGDIVTLSFDPPTKCPTCGHVHEKRKRNPARKRKTWTVQVPDDEENGAQVLDDIVDVVATVFELDLNGGALTRYHALARAGAFVLANATSIPKEAKG